MKTLLTTIAILLTASNVFADQFINGYTRQDGTYVKPHVRSDPDGVPQNNYSYKPSQPSTWGSQKPGYSGNTWSNNNNADDNE